MLIAVPTAWMESWDLDILKSCARRTVCYCYFNTLPGQSAYAQQPLKDTAGFERAGVQQKFVRACSLKSSSSHVL